MAQTAEITNGTNMPADIPNNENAGLLHLQSVERIAQLPVVESTLQTGKSIYEKIKDYNSLTNWSCSTAESTVNMAVEYSKPYAVPVINTLEGPIKKVDDLMCTGLDFVEEKVPAVKLPPGEMLLQLYNNTKDYISNLGPVQTTKNIVNPAVQGAIHMAEPMIEGAKHVIEPAIESAKHVIEPAIEGAKNIVGSSIDTVSEKVGSLVGGSGKKESEEEKADEPASEAQANPNP